MVAFHAKKIFQIMLMLALTSYFQLEASLFGFGCIRSSQVNAVIDPAVVELQGTSTISDLQSRITIYPENVDQNYTINCIYLEGGRIDGRVVFGMAPEYPANSLSIHDKTLIIETLTSFASVFGPVLENQAYQLKKTQAMLAESTKCLNECVDRNLKLRQELVISETVATNITLRRELALLELQSHAMKSKQNEPTKQNLRRKSF